MEKNKKHKNIIKRMIDFANANSLKMMFLLIMGYFWYQLAKDFRFEESLLSSSNILLIVILAFFGWMILKMMKVIKSEEDLTTDIKLITKDKLWYEREILKDRYQKLKNDPLQKLRRTSD